MNEMGPSSGPPRSPLFVVNTVVTDMGPFGVETNKQKSEVVNFKLPTTMLMRS